MPRKSRNIIENGIYHLMCRGNNKQFIFSENNDYLKYLELLEKYKNKYNIIIYNFVLMINHIHLLITCNLGKELSAFMKCLNLSYSTYYRKKSDRIGYFYQGRFKSIIVDSGKYLIECARYIEYNPVKVNICSSPEEYIWSSARYYFFDEYSNIITPNPEIIKLSDNKLERQKIYREFLLKGKEERRSEERLVREAVYGSQNFKKALSKKGIKGNWSHKGRPKSN